MALFRNNILELQNQANNKQTMTNKSSEPSDNSLRWAYVMAGNGDREKESNENCELGKCDTQTNRKKSEKKNRPFILSFWYHSSMIFYDFFFPLLLLFRFFTFEFHIRWAYYSIIRCLGVVFFSRFFDVRCVVTIVLYSCATKQK